MKSVYRFQALLLVALLSVSGLYALNITTTISQTLDYGYEPNQLSASAEISLPEIGFVAGLQVSPATFDSTFHYSTNLWQHDTKPLNAGFLADIHGQYHYDTYLEGDFHGGPFLNWIPTPIDALTFQAGFLEKVSKIVNLNPAIWSHDFTAAIDWRHIWNNVAGHSLESHLSVSTYDFYRYYLFGSPFYTATVTLLGDTVQPTAGLQITFNDFWGYTPQIHTFRIFMSCSIQL